MTDAHNKLEMTIDASTQYATVYLHGKPVATVMRKRAYGSVGKMEFSVFALDGSQIGECMSAYGIRRIVSKHIAK